MENKLNKFYYRRKLIKSYKMYNKIYISREREEKINQFVFDSQTQMQIENNAYMLRFLVKEPN